MSPLSVIFWPSRQPYFFMSSSPDEKAAPVGEPVLGAALDDGCLVEHAQELLGIRRREAREHVLGAVVDVRAAEPVHAHDVRHARELLDLRHVGLEHPVRERDLVPHDEAEHPLAARRIVLERAEERSQDADDEEGQEDGRDREKRARLLAEEVLEDEREELHQATCLSPSTIERLADRRAGTRPARTPIPTASAKARVRTSG